MKRNYKILAEKIENLKGFEIKKPVHIVYNKTKMPVYRLKLEKYKHNPFILVASGMHGEEVGAVYALMESLKVLKKYSHRFNFIIYPCLSPYSYITGSRFFRYTRKRRHNEYNLNYQFYENTKHTVAKEVMRAIKKYKPAMTIDMHEDDNCTYLSAFERIVEGLKIIDLSELSRYIYKKDTCYGDIVKDGIILPTCEEQTLEYWSFIKGSKVSVTLELPGKLDIFTRIQLGKKSVDLMLKKFGMKNIGR